MTADQAAVILCDDPQALEAIRTILSDAPEWRPTSGER